ncbi:MAG: universal stress protein UspA [Fervidicoccus sp.]|nr:MAG: universal stress protein UspA [Fervidicoccus sp.]
MIALTKINIIIYSKRDDHALYSKILIAYDGSPSAKLALSKACEIAMQFHSELLVTTVIEPIEIFYGEPIPPEIISKQKEIAQRIIERAKKYIESMGLEKVRYIIKTGIPANEIVKTADEENVDLIVIGRKSKKGILERVLVGSVSHSVLNLVTNRDVLITPYTEKED